MQISYADPHHPRFLITRLSAVGDCIHSMPIIGALRRQFPGAFIAWATQGLPATLLRDYPDLDRVITVDRNWLKSFHQIKNLRRTLHELQFDVSIDPHSLTKSAMLGWLSGARCRIGFDRPQGRELSLLLNNVRFASTLPHVVDKYLELLRPLGIEQPSSPKFEMAEWQHEKVDQFLHDTHLSGEFAVINPGAGWDSKLWPAKRFGLVAKHLGRVHRLPSVIVWAGDREQILAREIAEHSGGHGLIAPSTTLPELTTLMRYSKLCVAADTGPLHLAAAVDTRCVGLYGPTLPSECGPYGPQHVSVQTCYQDGNGRQRRGADNEAMCAIRVSQVTDACDRLLVKSQAA